MKLLLVVACCVFFIGGCSSQEEIGSFVPETIDVPDSISNNRKLEDTVVNYTKQPEILIVAKNIVVAHRGAWKKKNLPQNSIASLEEAIQLQCKGSEFDIVLAADDSLVVCHDAKYNNLIVQESKYSDLITLKLPNGESLPTLREYIIAGKQNNTTTLLYCEFKNYGLTDARKKVFINKTLELVNKLNAQNLLVYISFDYDILKQVRALNAMANLQYLKGDFTPDQLKLDNMSGVDYSGDTYMIRHREWIDSAKKNNLDLNVWTVNDSYSINWFLKNNFGAITTDEPELVLSYPAALIK